MITPSRADFMKARANPHAQNTRLDHPLVPRRPLLKRLLFRPERRHHPSVGFYEHMPAWRVRAYVGEEVWRSYFKFTFERNPWDRQVSWFYYNVVDKGKTISFDDFLRRRRGAFVENYDLYSDDDDKIILDFVGRYEELESGFAEVLSRIGLNEPIAFPHVNHSQRSTHYRAFYKDRTREIVANWYRREIDHFGYGF